jgi:hypothetical protein
MQIQYICDRCNTPYQTKEAAEQCESNHPGIGHMKIDGCRFESSKGLYNDELENSKQFPERIRIKFGKDKFAIYTLESIGYRGV